MTSIEGRSPTPLPSRALTAAHLVGVVLFLGGIAAAIVLGAAHHLSDLEAFRTRRAIAADLTFALIVPGMWLAVVSGAAMAWRRRRGLRLERWVLAKAIAGVGLVLNGTLALVPLVHRIGALLVQSPPSLTEAGRLQGLEDRLGAVNLLLAVGCLALGVWRPGTGRRARPASGEVAGEVAAS